MRILKSDFWLGKTVDYKAEVDFSVTVVVPAWNEEKYIGATIESILAQDYPVKVVVVNDRSTDKTREIAESYPITVLNPDEKAGSKSRALNYAIDFLDTDIFICVDADTILEPDAVGILVKAFADEKVMVASGYVHAVKDQDNFWQGGRAAEYTVGQRIVKDAQANANSILVASGCFMAIRVPFLKEHKFDERTMAEDMDLTWTAIQAGWNVAFANKAICHVHDPFDWHTYSHQVLRWYRGFFQNIVVRKGNLGWRINMVAYPYIIINMIGAPLVLLMFASILMGNILALKTFVVYSIAVFLIAAFYEKSFFRFGKDYVRMFFLSFLTYFLYMKSFWKEIVMRDKLTTWVKGH